MKEVLVAAYYFPPYADISGTRITKFCKYLPAEGWRPRVLTVDPRYYRGKVVAALPPEVAGMDVRRVPYVPLPGAVLAVKMLFPLIVALAAWQDRRRLAAVHMVGSPFHPFIAAAVTRTLLGLPTVLDFRDSWSINPMFSRFRSPLVARVVKAARGLVERIGVRHASAVTFATEKLMEDYAAVLPRHRHKFRAIDNGFDPDDFRDVTPERLFDGPTLVVAGKIHFYTPEVAEHLMTVLAERPELHLVYVGGEADVMARLAAAAGVSDRVAALPFQPTARVVRLIAGADYGVLTHVVPYAFGTKLYDYLALGKPMACFVPHGSAIAGAFRDVPGVIVRHPPHDAAQVRDAVARLVALPPAAADAGVERFSRRHATARLARLLDRLTAGATVPAAAPEPEAGPLPPQR